MSVRSEHGTLHRAPLLVSKGWLQAVALVMLFSFFMMGILTYRTYSASMPLPERVETASGQVVFTADDVTSGQELFLARGLQQYGTVMGHGAYFGPDYTADYLRRSSQDILEQLRQAGSSDPRTDLQTMQRTNRYDPNTGVLTFTPEQAAAFGKLTSYYQQFFSEPTTKHALPPNLVSGEDEIKDLTAFFAWTSWASAANQPGHTYSYTNDWPKEPLVGNEPTADQIVWSALSLTALLVGLAVLFAAYGRWSDKIGWHAVDAKSLVFKQPGDVAITPAQRATVWFFIVMMLMFFVQVMLGALIEHYRVEPDGFYGIDIAQVLPFNLARTWHLQLSVLWPVTGFLAAGIFLAPYISGREPKGQNKLTYLLFFALVIVVVGSFAGEALSIFDIASGPLATMQWEWLDLPRVWQVLLVAGLFIWIAIVFRGIRARLKREHPLNLPWLFFYTGLAIPAFYAVGLLATTQSHITVAEFWRFWVVHLWVEDFLELFTTVMVAYLFVILGVVRRRMAMVIILFDAMLYSVGGVLGTMHHVYFSGTSVEHMALGAFFSAMEVIPLTFLTLEAWTFLRLGSKQQATDNRPFPHKWAVMFLVAVGFWNFVGAGVMGFLINLPIVSYYEIGTALTANHAHGAMMGVYGMMAIGLALFALRYQIPKEKWPEKWAQFSFWCLNIGLAWMMFITLLPLGVMQLWQSVTNGYFEAREISSILQPGNAVLEWLRMPGDLIFIAGIIPLIYIAFLGVTSRVRATTHLAPIEKLYVTEAEAAEEMSGSTR